jgi:hypothetical protein
VEALRVGDRAVTASGRSRPILWIGHRRLDLRRHPRPQDVMPVRVQAGAFGPGVRGEGVPRRDVLLSPDHAVFAGGVLVPVRYLVNGLSIAQEAAEAITYYHVELDAHDVLLAEGLPAESYLNTGNRGAFANGGDVIEAHPDFARRVWAASSCADLVMQGPVLAHIRAGLLARLPALGHATTDDPDLLVCAGGVVLEPQSCGDWLCVVVPDDADTLHLHSRTACPAELDVGSDDRRRLGVPVAAVRIDGEAVPLDGPAVAEGWWPAEDGLRWTGGAATLRVPPGAIVELRTPRWLRYGVPSAVSRARHAA